MINSIELVRKQEEYRNKTISLVAELSTEGKSKEEIAEEAGISKAEVDVVLREINRKKVKGRPNMRRFF
ncbi:hypothetical protein [Priestia aryabhattai]|uniref:Uncharacterized protein n=1 Tax=Priestia aryabhattai TaxID=412384 RepID=A0ABD7WU44_PRIAR|nr:hypothetical protein [Priestia aryabhattai]WEA43811.1 hypothetical protein PWO00_23750 [Priestia aryabhattai]